jgi:hypothetical protein
MTALTAKITAIAVAAAIALTGGLAIQMARGNDPALASKTKATTTNSSSDDSSSSASQSTSNQATSAPATVTTRTS